MLIQLYTLQTSWCEYWWVFARNGLVLQGSYTSWLQVGGQTRTRDVYTLDSGLWRTAGPPTRALGRTRAELSGDPQGQVAGQGGTQKAGGAGAARPAGSRTDNTHVSSQHGRAAGSRRRGRAGHRAAPFSVLLQWAAKVAFFKLKLDQLMDSLCRVCLAESKQNLEDKKLQSWRGPEHLRCWRGTVPLGTPASTLDNPAVPCPFPLGPQGKYPAWPGSATALSLPSLTHESRGCDVKHDSAPPNPAPRGSSVQPGAPRLRLQALSALHWLPGPQAVMPKFCTQREKGYFLSKAFASFLKCSPFPH